MQIPITSPFTSIEDLVPNEWVEPRNGKALLMIAYEVQGIAASGLTQPLACDLKDVRVLVWKGNLSYREEVKVTRFWIDDARRFNIVEPEPTAILKTPDGLYAIFMSHYTVTPDTNQGELEAQRRIEIAAALFDSFQGRNVIFQKMYENTYNFETKAALSWSAPILVPFSYPTPDLTAAGFKQIIAAERARWSLGDVERNRLELSLRWFLQGSFATGIDAFLKLWFAIEVLAMPSDTNIAPLNDVVANIYELTDGKQASATFHIGLLFGLRSKIVHRGFMPALDDRLLRYCEHLYHDVLRHSLNLPSERRLGQLANDPSFDYGAILRSLLQA
jgi:hypothetical protein